jgi:hypothetical protein
MQQSSRLDEEAAGVDFIGRCSRIFHIILRAFSLHLRHLLCSCACVCSASSNPTDQKAADREGALLAEITDARIVTVNLYVDVFLERCLIVVALV